MRITNTMMTNSMLLSINKNRATMAKYEEQLSSGKQIQKPSDDPIVAARALKFRTNVSEIEQYTTNVSDATSWIEVTEQAISNTTDIMQRISELAVQGSTGTLSTENRVAIISEIEQLKEQIVSEGNASYAGRYIFAGYQTDKSLSYLEDSSEAYEITENLTSSSIETVDRVYGDEIHEVSRIRLGYSNIEEAATAGTISGFTVIALDSTSTAPSTEAYAPESTSPPTVHFLKDTGELIFNTADIASIPAEIDFTYQKSSFEKGDLRPDHYFNSTNLTTNVEYTKDEEAMEYQVSYSQNMQVNVMGYDVITSDLVRDLEELINATNAISYDDSTSDTLKQDLLSSEFSKLIDKIDGHLENNSNVTSTLGGKINRLDLTLERLTADNLNFTSLLSENEDVDMAETLIKFSSQEVVYNAALSASSKIIQPTLLDFLS
jgi:flagellar hook-associated protein 3 FlgL